MRSNITLGNNIATRISTTVWEKNGSGNSIGSYIRRLSKLVCVRQNTLEADIDIKTSSAAEAVMHLSITLRPQAGD